MKTILQKGDIVKITEGFFKDIYGEFVGILPKGKEGKKYGWSGGTNHSWLIIKTIQFGKIQFVPCDELSVKKAIQKCWYCQKVLNLSPEEMGDYVVCNECRAEDKSGKYFHFDKMKWLRKKPESWKELDKRTKEFEKLKNL